MERYTEKRRKLVPGLYIWRSHYLPFNIAAAALRYINRYCGRGSKTLEVHDVPEAWEFFDDKATSGSLPFLKNIAYRPTVNPGLEGSRGKVEATRSIAWWLDNFWRDVSSKCASTTVKAHGARAVSSRRVKRQVRGCNATIVGTRCSITYREVNPCTYGPRYSLSRRNYASVGLEKPRLSPKLRNSGFTGSQTPRATRRRVLSLMELC